MTIKTLEPFLAEHLFFKGMEKDHIALLVGCAKNVRFKEGEAIFKMGGSADHFYLIRHGKISVEIPVPGRAPVSIQTLADGDVLGWSWLYPPYKWIFDARALEATRAIALDGKCLRTKCDEDPVMGYELMKRFSQIMMDRLSAAQLQLIDMYGPNS